MLGLLLNEIQRVLLLVEFGEEMEFE